MRLWQKNKICEVEFCYFKLSVSRTLLKSAINKHHKQTTSPAWTTVSNKWSRDFDERLHRISCRYWGLSDPFCCVHRSWYSQCLSVDRTTPKIALPVDGSNTWFVRRTRVSHSNGISIGLVSFAGLTNVTNRQTDRHADRSRYSVCSNRSLLAFAVMWPNKRVCIVNDNRVIDSWNIFAIILTLLLEHSFI